MMDASHTLFRRHAHAVGCLLLAGVVFYSSYGLANHWAARRAPVPEVVFAWETHIPFWAWTIVPYWSLNLFYAAAFFVARNRIERCRYLAQLLCAQALAVLCFLLWPLQFSWPKPAADGLSGWLFASLAAFDQPYNQAPSLHIILTLVVGRFYWHRLPRRWRLPWLMWLGLIALSVLTTYQHHFIDIPTGVLAGLLIWWLFPHRLPAPWQQRHHPQTAHRRWAALYLGLAGLCVLAASGGKTALWWLWPACTALLLAAAYLGLGAAALQKQHNGRLSPACACLLLPYLPLARLNMAYWLRDRTEKSSPVTDKVHIGSLLAAPYFEAVVDVCGEYPLWRPPANYVCQPMLDMAPPRPTDLCAATAALQTLLCQQAQPVLVCCALGYGRSAAVVLLWLWRYGGCADLAEAETRLRHTRPQMVLPPATRAAIVAAHALLPAA